MKDRSIGLRIDDDLLAWVKVAAAADCRSVGGYIHLVLERHRKAIDAETVAKFGDASR